MEGWPGLDARRMPEKTPGPKGAKTFDRCGTENNGGIEGGGSDEKTRAKNEGRSKTRMGKRYGY